jgi:hypothetical protein
MRQLQAEQPATTCAEFKKEILSEIARCSKMPFKQGMAGRKLFLRGIDSGSPSSSPTRQARWGLLEFSTATIA